MLGKRTIVATLMVALMCSVSVALADGGTIKGVAKWEGKPYTQKPLPGVDGADPYCTKEHKKNPILNEKLVINENSTVRDVFVYVKSGLPAGQTWDVTTEPVVLNQKGCHYEPHVFGVMAGQDLIVRNSDNTAHNINTNPKNNDGFNKGQPKKGMEFTESFDTPEMMVRIKCDVHSWMSAYCAVMEHPFFATTDENGNFEITGLPNGTYVLATWAERFKKGQEMTVTISGGETQEVEFVFKKPKKKKKKG